MDPMDIDEAASSGAKRKADEVPLQSESTEVKRLRPNEPGPGPESQTSILYTYLQSQIQAQQQHPVQAQAQAQVHSTTTTNTTTDPNLTPEARREALRPRFHALSRELVQRRDKFHHDSAEYETVASLYDGMSYAIEGMEGVDDLKRWTENVCVELLERFMRLEEQMRLIVLVERKLWWILFILKGNV